MDYGETFLKFMEEETKKERERKLKMAQMYAKAKMQQTHFYVIVTSKSSYNKP